MKKLDLKNNMIIVGLLFMILSGVSNQIFEYPYSLVASVGLILCLTGVAMKNFDWKRLRFEDVLFLTGGFVFLLSDISNQYFYQLHPLIPTISLVVCVLGLLIKQVDYQKILSDKKVEFEDGLVLVGGIVAGICIILEVWFHQGHAFILLVGIMTYEVGLTMKNMLAKDEKQK